MKRILAVLFIMVLAVACSKKDSEQAKTKGGDSFLVKIGELSITKADIDKELQTMPEQIRKAVSQDRRQYERFLDDYSTKEMLYNEAVKKGIDKDKDFVRKVEYLRKIKAIETMIEREISDKTKVTDKEFNEYYKKHPEEFTEPDNYVLSNILVKTEDAAKKIQERLKKGEDFAKLAKEVSEDKESAKNGGDIGTLVKGSMPPEFTKALENLKKGDITQPFKTQFGFHILKVKDIKKGAAIDIKSIKEDMKRVMGQEKYKDAFEKYILNLKQRNKTEINKTELDKMFPELPEKTGSGDKAVSPHGAKK